MMTLFLHAIRQAPPGTDIPGAAPAGEEIPMRDIAAPLEVPLPLWQVILYTALAVAVIAAMAWWIWHWWKTRPAAPVHTPREIALAALERLQAQVQTLDPQEFSFQVSAVLRRFLEDEFHLRAVEQTSEEFLVDVAQSPRFSQEERRSLAEFLERSDMIKFARQGAEASASEALVASALAVVQRGRA